MFSTTIPDNYTAQEHLDRTQPRHHEEAHPRTYLSVLGKMAAALENQWNRFSVSLVTNTNLLVVGPRPARSEALGLGLSLLLEPSLVCFLGSFIPEV